MAECLEVGFNSIRTNPDDKKTEILEVLRLTDAPTVGQRIGGKYEILDVQNHPDPNRNHILLLTVPHGTVIDRVFIPII